VGGYIFTETVFAKTRIIMGWQRCQMTPKTLEVIAKQLIYIDIFYGV
jgi:hypothetical protein